MPFTFAHPALVIPFIKLPARYISGTAIIIGSMAPDFEYFLLLQKERIIGHTWYGAILLDLPLTLLFAFIFHSFIKRPFIENLPEEFSARFVDTLQLHWDRYFAKHWFTVVYSSLLGIYSHILWDLFTHRNTYIEEHLPFLLQEISFGLVSFPAYKFLQIISTIVGFFIIAISIIRKKPISHNSSDPNHGYWLKIALTTTVFLIVRLLMGIDYTDYVIVLINFISGLFLATLVVSIFIMGDLEQQ